jgi:hypothetical protein
MFLPKISGAPVPHQGLNRLVDNNPVLLRYLGQNGASTSRKGA